MLRIGCVQVGLQPAMVLHAIGKGIADVADVVALLQFDRGLCHRGGPPQADKGQQTDKNAKPTNHAHRSHWVSRVGQDPATRIRAGLSSFTGYFKPSPHYRRNQRSPNALFGIKISKLRLDRLGLGGRQPLRERNREEERRHG